MELEVGTEVPTEEVPDLSGLDHNFFLSETNRLLRRAQSVHDRLYIEAYGTSRRGGADKDRALDVAASLLGTLQSYRGMMVEEVPFEAHTVLQELHQLDSLLSLVQSGQPLPLDAADRLLGPAHEPRLLDADSAYDHHHYHDDHMYHDYDEYDDEDYNERGDFMAAGLRRTPGRRPTTRKQLSRR